MISCVLFWSAIFDPDCNVTGLNSAIALFDMVVDEQEMELSNMSHVTLGKDNLYWLSQKLCQLGTLTPAKMFADDGHMQEHQE